MKQILLIFILCSVFIQSCEKKEGVPADSDIVGKWRLVEVLVDPGDGSGTFQSVTSNKFLEFHPNKTITSNGLICSMSAEANEPDTGTYSLADSTINAPGCGNPVIKITFTITDSDLIIYYPCIEPCMAKYEKK